MPRYIDANALKFRMLNYYDCVSENTKKSNYRGETLMNYEVADMIEDCIENAPTADVAPRAEVAREIFEELRRYIINHCYLADDDVDAIWKHIDILEKRYTEDNNE